MYTNPLNSCYGNPCVQGLPPRANPANPPLAGAPAQTAVDSLSLDALNSVPQFLYGNMIEALNQEFGVTSIGAASADAAPLTFKDLIDRITAVIAPLSSAASDSSPDEVNTRVHRALQQAMQDSKEVLRHYGKLDAATEQQIDDTIAAILNPPANNGATIANVTVPEVAANNSVAAAAYASIDRSQSTLIQIKTREGDLVTIDLSKQSGASVTTAYGASNGTQVTAQQQTQYQSSQLNFSVQGDLNKDERHAIEKLLKKVDRIADKFYSGDVTAAFKKASHLGFDAQTLVGVSLSMNYSETTKAISVYQAVGDTTSATTPATIPATRGTLPDAAQFAQGVHDVITDPTAQQVLANPAQSMGKLVEAATQLKNDTRHPAGHSLDDLTKALKAIIDAVVNLAGSTAPANVVQEPTQAIAA